MKGRLLVRWEIYGVVGSKISTEKPQMGSLKPKDGFEAQYQGY